MASGGHLSGVRVWLSGAVPEEGTATEDERRAVMEFVRRFSTLVFQQGGHIVHGSHPSLTPVLLEGAKEHQTRGGRRDCLTLAVSRQWSKNSSEVAEWEKTCTVYQTPEKAGEDARDENLQILRQWILARCDAFVAVGGMWWRDIAARSGLPIETQMAVERGLPCFVLGGLGGAARDFVRDHPEFLRSLRNGFDDDANRAFATRGDVGGLAAGVADQLARLPTVRGRISDGYSFRILALDGGGMKGTFTAAALATWEQHFHARIVDHFDLIAGTSTGGILAIGLGLGMTANEMLGFYRTRGPTIFPLTSMADRFLHAVRHVFRPKHSQEVLLKELQSAYYAQGRPHLLKDSLCRLVIPSFHALGGTSHVFRTPHHQLLVGDAETDAAHAALATSAAPTFFSAAKVGNMIAESRYFDGGVWANCPAMAAIIEGVCYLGVPLDRIDILSVGTTEEPVSFKQKIHAGLLGWNKGLIDLLMNAQAESSLRHAQLLTGEPRFLRINTMTKPGTYSLDSPREIEDLASLGNLEASRPDILAQIGSRFLNGVQVSPWTSAAGRTT